MEIAAAPREHHHEDQIIDEAQSDFADLSVVATGIDAVDRPGPLETVDDVEAETPPLGRFMAFRGIEADLHGINVHPSKRSVNIRVHVNSRIQVRTSVALGKIASGPPLILP